MTKNAEQNLVSEILESPIAPILMDQIKSKLEIEQKNRLTFYDNDITENEKVEFINGQIILHSPVVKYHNEITLNLSSILKTYVVENDLGFVGAEKIMVKFTRNDYEPDICFFNKSKADQFKQDQILFPVPDMIVEILSKSTEKRDRGIKFDDYQNHDVKEYWIIDPKKKIIEQYINTNKKFELILKSNSGEIKSNAISKLVLPITTIFDSKLTNKFIKSIL